MPSAEACLERSLASCLTSFHFPAEQWVSLRTSNIIERLNKEFKRRTEPMEIVAGELSCYRLLAFTSLNRITLAGQPSRQGTPHSALL